MPRLALRRIVRTVRSAAAAAGLSAGVAAGAAFASPLDFAAPERVAGIASGGAIATHAADLDRDGVPEIITTASRDSSDPHFRIYRFDGTSWLVVDVLPPSEVDDKRGGRFGGALATADVDGDGWLDILVPDSPNNAGDARVSVFWNPGPAGLTASWGETEIARWPDPSVSGQPQDARHMAEIAAGDLDGDGDIDVVTRDVDHGVFVLENVAGSYVRHFVPANPREGLALFDPDGDGDLDILLNGAWLEAPDPGPGLPPNLSGTSQYVLHEIRGKNEAAALWYPSGNSEAEKDDYASKVLAIDLDGDGREDVAITNAEELANASSTESKPKGLWVYYARDGTGTLWEREVLQNEGFDLHTLDGADLDGDGRPELLSGVSRVGLGDSDREVFVFHNGGAPQGWSRESIASLNIYSGILTDVDGDGRSDIVAPDHWNSGEIRWFRNETTPVPEPTGGGFVALAALVGLARGRRLRRRGVR